VLVSVPVPTGVDMKRMRLSGGGAATTGDNSWLNELGDAEKKVITSSPPVVPSIKLEDCLFSPEVAKIMANYKPPAASASNILAAPDLVQETVLETVTNMSPKGAGEVPFSSSSTSSSRAPSPRPHATTPSAVTELQAAGSAQQAKAREQALLEEALAPVAAAATTTATTDAPAFWSYNASTTTFGLKDCGETQTAARPTYYELTPWILTDGPPVFSATSSLKRKRELDESQIVQARLQEMVGATRKEMGQGASAPPAPANSSTSRTLQDLMFLVESEKAAGSALDQKVTDAILAPRPKKLR